MLKEELEKADGRLRASADDHVGVVIGYRIHRAEEDEATVAMDEPRTIDACLAIIVGAIDVM